MALYAFNRRTTEDQIIYVRAYSLEEAWRKARADEAEDTSDTEQVGRSTLRRLVAMGEGSNEGKTK